MNIILFILLYSNSNEPLVNKVFIGVLTGFAFSIFLWIIEK